MAGGRLRQGDLFATDDAAAERAALVFRPHSPTNPLLLEYFDWVESECQRVLQAIDAKGRDAKGRDAMTAAERQTLRNWADFITERVERFNEDIEDWIAGRPEKQRWQALNYRTLAEDSSIEELRLPPSEDEDE